MDSAYVDGVARKVRSGAYTWGWALRLISQHLEAMDAWSPMAALCEAIRRQTRG